VRTLIASIVEGHGEVSALPVLMQRWLAHIGRSHEYQVLDPVRVGVDRLKNPFNEERQQGIEYAIRASLRRKPGAILVLLDADRACALPASGPRLGPALLARARVVAPHLDLAVVVADPEYEAWFLRNAPAVFPGVADVQPTRRDCKGLVSELLGTKYLEGSDQAQLTKRLPLPEPAAIPELPDPSYRKLFKELARLMPPAPS
jgi:hypothetical protein